MIALIQRVISASVTVEDRTTAGIQRGMLALIGIEKSDTHESARALASKILTFRLFSDAAGKMNLDLKNAGGQILLVPQFTLAADTHKGRRPGFSSAATPSQAFELFTALGDEVLKLGIEPELGRFGTDMQVALVNDGPVTFWLQTSPAE